MILNLVIIILILINLIMCSYGLYNNQMSENYADGPSAFKKARSEGLKSFKSRKTQENYRDSPQLKRANLLKKFNKPSNEGYKADTRQRLQTYLSNM